jgi:uncharacterized protein (DUF1697 family)
MRYLALLRGINVGGKNLIRMPELRASFERAGFTNVTTYIQSGNVLLDTKVKDPMKLSARIEQVLVTDFGCSSVVVVVTQDQLQDVMQKAPPGFGSDPERYRYDVVFIKPPLCAHELLPAISLKEGVDEGFESSGVLYFRRLIEKASQSLLPKLVNHAAYKSMTIRNWNTTRELHRLMLLV